MRAAVVLLLCCVLVESDALRHSTPVPSSDEVHTVTYDTPSVSSANSMPIGNGNLGANVWANRNGSDKLDVFVLVGKNDAWSGNTRLLKPALVKFTVESAQQPAAAVTKSYSETFDARCGCVTIATELVSIVVWTDPESNNIRVTAIPAQAAGTAPTVTAAAELLVWRKGAYLDDPISARGLCTDKIWEEADTIASEGDRLIVYHQNTESAYGDSIKLQGLDGFQGTDPLMGRTFGCEVTGLGMKAVNSTHLAASAAPRAELAIVCETGLTIDEWQRVMVKGRKVCGKTTNDQSLTAAKSYWNKVFHDSYIDIEGGLASKARNATVTAVSRGYVLQRFIDLAAGQKGPFPIKFNGLIFSVNTTKDDYDTRLWGGGYWFQNTRQMYWSALASGDYAMMKHLFNMYFAALPLAQHRVRTYWGHEGAFFPETMWFWGGYEDSDYGCDRTHKASWWVDNTYIRHHINNGIELVSLMLQYYLHTEDHTFASQQMAPFAESVLSYFAWHFPPDINGKLVLTTSSLETYQSAINPTPDVAGLSHVLSVFATLSNDVVPKSLSDVLEYLADHLPPLPMSADGKTVAPAMAANPKTENSENVGLYAVWPYRQIAITKNVDQAALAIGRTSFAARPFPCNDGWCQDIVDAAVLAMPNDAADRLVDRFTRAPATGMRFPAFFGPMQDSTPANDHGSTARIAMQYMLMQSDGRDIIMFPAWPSYWGDVTFKLHAPLNTVVEGRCENGKLVHFAVTPSSRADDVAMPFGECGSGAKHTAPAAPESVWDTLLEQVSSHSII